MKNLYEILGVKKDADFDEIKDAYRKKSKACHPDTRGGDAEKFKELNKAYQVLSNEEKRARYDAGESHESILSKNETPEEIGKKIIIDVFCAVIEKNDPDQFNIVEIIDLEISNAITQIEMFISIQEMKKKRFEKAARKIRGKSDFLKSVSLHQAKTAGQVAEGLGQGKKNYTAALELLREFSFDCLAD